MAFYSQDPQLEEQLSTALAEITQLAPEELSNISATWVVYNNSPIDIAS